MTRNAARTGLGATTLLLVLAACATPQEKVASKEDKLVAAGFQARPADTPQRQAMLQKLPANHFAIRKMGDGYIYLYADPLVCGCLYVGSQAAYSQYKQEMFQQHLADEQQLTAQINSEPQWDFGGWGGPFGPGFGGGFGPGFY